MNNNIMNDGRTPVHIAKFDNLDDFLNYVRDEKVSYLFKNHLHSISGDMEFTGTRSYKDAWNLCRYTMNEGFSDFAEKFDSLQYYIDLEERKVNNNSVYGYLPNVPRFLLNIPTSMHSYQMEKNNPTIHIYMNYGYEAMTSIDAVRNRGVIVLSLIQYLEKKGFNVNFYGFDLGYTRSHSEGLFVEIPMKKEYEKINLKLLYFPLVHPSFLRRLLFRVTEKMPLTSDEWLNGYGVPATYEESVKFIKNYRKQFDSNDIIFISTPNELKIYGNNLKDDYDRAISIINKKYNINDCIKRRH